MLKQWRLLTAYHIIKNFSFYTISNLLMAQSLVDKDIWIGELNDAKEAKLAAHLLNQALDSITTNPNNKPKYD